MWSWIRGRTNKWHIDHDPTNTLYQSLDAHGTALARRQCARRVNALSNQADASEDVRGVTGSELDRDWKWKVSTDYISIDLINCASGPGHSLHPARQLIRHQVQVGDLVISTRVVTMFVAISLQVGFCCRIPSLLSLGGGCMFTRPHSRRYR